MHTLPLIKQYTFGRMVIEHHTYTSDLIILPNGTVMDNWIRQQGHLLLQSDITRLLEKSPKMIVVGTGASGRMKVDPGLVSHLEHLGIRARIFPCHEAVDIYNSLADTGDSMGACFHLTC